MFILFSFVIISIIVINLYLRWMKVKNYWALRGVPHVPPVPLVGSLTFLQRENIAYWLRRMYKNATFGKTPYVGIWVFWRPGIVVNSPEIARNILVKDFYNFKNRSLGCGKSDPIGHFNLFCSKDHIWSDMRKQITVMFTSSKLRFFQDYTRIKAKELMQRIRNDRNIHIDLKEMYIDYTTDVIGTTALGVESDATLTGTGPLRNIVNEFSRYSLYRSVGWCCIFFLPEMVDFFRFKFFPKSTIDYFKRIFREVLSQRGTVWKQREIKDLLDILIRIQKENETFTEDQILAQAAIFLQAGFDTSGHLLIYATYELAHNPEIQDKLYRELFEAKKRCGNDNFDITTLSELTYLNCVIKEALRMYSPMGWIDRTATADYVVDDKLTIEAGTPVYINAAGMHYDPEYYPEPNKFNPDRFLPENKTDPYAFLPFGEGPRNCIGKRFGLITAQFALTELLLNYTVMPLPNTPKPSDIKISSRTVWFIPGETLRVKFVPRK